MSIGIRLIIAMAITLLCSTVATAQMDHEARAQLEAIWTPNEQWQAYMDEMMALND